MKGIIIIVMFVISLSAMVWLYVYEHEQTHAQICKMYNGNPKITMFHGFDAMTTCEGNITSPKDFINKNLDAEIVGYHAISFYILACIAVLTLVVNAARRWNE